MLQLIQIAQLEQAAVDALANLSMSARTNLQLAKIRVTDRKILPQVTYTATQRAVRIAWQVMQAEFTRRLILFRLPSQRTGGDLSQCLVYSFAHRVLFLSSG